MKRQLIFDAVDGQYVIKENDSIIFSIDGKGLKFVSLDFYNGIYKDNSAAIDLTNAIVSDELKNGNYIFSWLSEITTAIQEELNEPELEDMVSDSHSEVWLYELAACAGDGFYNDETIREEEKVESPIQGADFAVKISGQSMEPTIVDQSIVFVKKVEELADNDIGIFVVDGKAMCKRYRDDGKKKWLEPDNPAYSSIYFNENSTCIIQGKVLLS